MTLTRFTGKVGFCNKIGLTVMVLILLLSAVVRLGTYYRYLPYTDYSDESNYFMLALDWRQTDLARTYGADLVGKWLGSYPPLYIWLNMAVQSALEATWGKGWISTGEYLVVLRLIAVLLGILMTALVIALGRAVVSPLAGALAGLIWALTPRIVETNNFAIPDSLLYPAVAAAILFAIWAWRKQSALWTLFSLMAAIAAIYIKYVPVYALIPWGLVTFALARRNFRRMLPYLVTEAIVAAASAAYLIHGLTSVGLSNQEAVWTQTEGLQRMLSFDRNLNNWQIMIEPIGAGLLTIGLAAGVAAFVYSRRKQWRTVNLAWLGFVLVATLPAVPVSAQISHLSEKITKIRFVLPATIGIAVLWAAAIVQVFWLLKAWNDAREKHQSDLHRPAIGLLARRMLPVGLLGIIGLIWVGPALIGDWQLATKFNRIDTITLLWRWTDANLPDDGLILAPTDSEASVTWNRPWSGYDGAKSFQWWIEPVTGTYSPAQYLARNIKYLVLTDKDLIQFTTATEQSLLSQLLLIKTIQPDSTTFGPTVYFYAMQSPAINTNARFGDQIRLVGYDLSQSDLTVVFRPYWQIDHRPTSNYSVYVHLYSLDGDPANDPIIVQFDGALSTTQRLTLTWDDRNELYLGPQVTLHLPATLKPGTYQLRIGLYDYNTGQRLLTSTNKDSITILVHFGLGSPAQFF